MKRIEASAPTIERRDERIDAVIAKYWDVLSSGNDQPHFSYIEWDETVDAKTTVTLWCRQDDRAEAIASELRCCGCVVSVCDEVVP